MEEDIAIIILNYFGYEDTLSCVNSIHNTKQSNIFILDNSEDINEYNKLKIYFEKEPDIHVLCSDENIGFAAGVNSALRTSIDLGYKRFFLLNNDTILKPDAEKILNSAFQKYPGCLIAPTIKWGHLTCRGNYYHKYLGIIKNNYGIDKNLWHYYFTGCALAFDKNIIDKVGYMNESFFMYGEDVEYSYRCSLKKTPLILLEDELVFHKGNSSSQSLSFFYEFHINRSHLLLCFFIFKNPAKIILSLTTKFLTLIGRAIYRSIVYRRLTPITALLLSLTGIKVRPKSKS